MAGKKKKPGMAYCENWGGSRSGAGRPKIHPNNPDQPLCIKFLLLQEEAKTALMEQQKNGESLHKTARRLLLAFLVRPDLHPELNKVDSV